MTTRRPRIVVGLTGGIAAYKVVDVIRDLVVAERVERPIVVVTNDRAVRDNAFILETPIDNEGDDQRNVDALKSLIS